MSISFDELKTALKSTKLAVFRDKARLGTMYPYIVYSNVSNSKKWHPVKSIKITLLPSLFFTLGTEQDLVVIEQALQNAGIPYSDFTGIQGDENDDTVTNYYTYVRCVENAK